MLLSEANRYRLTSSSAATTRDILQRYIPDESVDLVYLDPSFNSNRDYNVIFKDESGRCPAAVSSLSWVINKA